MARPSRASRRVSTPQTRVSAPRRLAKGQAAPPDLQRQDSRTFSRMSRYGRPRARALRHSYLKAAIGSDRGRSPRRVGKSPRRRLIAEQSKQYIMSPDLEALLRRVSCQPESVPEMTPAEVPALCPIPAKSIPSFTIIARTSFLLCAQSHLLLPDFLRPLRNQLRKDSVQADYQASSSAIAAKAPSSVARKRGYLKYPEIIGTFQQFRACR